MTEEYDEKMMDDLVRYINHNWKQIRILEEDNEDV